MDRFRKGKSNVPEPGSLIVLGPEWGEWDDGPISRLGVAFADVTASLRAGLGWG